MVVQFRILEQAGQRAFPVRDRPQHGREVPVEVDEAIVERLVHEEASKRTLATRDAGQRCGKIVRELRETEDGVGRLAEEFVVAQRRRRSDGVSRNEDCRIGRSRFDVDETVAEQPLRPHAGS